MLAILKQFFDILGLSKFVNILSNGKPSFTLLEKVVTNMEMEKDRMNPTMLDGNMETPCVLELNERTRQRCVG